MQPLIVPSDGTGVSALLDHPPGILHPHESAEPSAGTEDQSNLKPTVSSTAKLLRGVRDFADAFGPLRSVAGTLCFTLENFTVRPPPCTFNLSYLPSFQQADVDIQAIELLAPRIKAISESLCAPIALGDFNEKERGGKLER